MRKILRFILNIFYRVEVLGLENYTKAGKRVLLVANHTSFLDALLLAVYLPDNLGFAINSHIANLSIFKPFLRLVKTFPMDPTNPYALKNLIEILKKDEKCVIFPEGRITVTGSLMKIYEGPGMIADKSDANILPVKIEGAIYTPFSKMKGKVKTKFFPKIRIVILSPVKIKIPAEIKARQRRKQSGEELHKIMQNLMFKSVNLEQTIFEGLLEAVKINGYLHIIAEDIKRRPLNYRELLLGSFMLGAKFKKFSKIDENIGIMLPNSLANLISFFGLQSIARTPAMLNYSSGFKNVITACNTAEIKNVISSRIFIEKAKLANLVLELEKAEIKIIYLEDINSKTTNLDKLFSLFKTFFPKRYSIQSDPDQKAVILFTSGSEGVPKGVVLSHKNINANRWQISSIIDFNPTDKILNALPMFHSFGFTIATILPTLAGIKVFFYPSPLHYRIVPEMIYDTNATIIFGTDTFLSGYAKFANAYDFYSVRYAFAGAEKLKEETRKIYSEKYGVRIFEGYGSTETSPVLAMNTPMHNKAGTVGQLLPGIEYRLEQIAGIDEGGKIIVKGPNVMLGYYLNNNPGKLIPPAANEYDTGDIVSIDAEGYITIKGRAKRFAKVAGEMISLTAVEGYLASLWPNYNHAVIAIPDEKKGEQLVLFTTKADFERSEILNYIKNNGISELSIPRKINYINKIPVLGTGKADYVELKSILSSCS